MLQIHYEQILIAASCINAARLYKLILKGHSFFHYTNYDAGSFFPRPAAVCAGPG
jgi:hypothetical protein